MKAIIWTAYGPPEVLQQRDIPTPVPKDNQILVKVAVSNVFPGDCELRRFDVGFPFNILVRLVVGLFRPRKNSVLGQEYAGVVQEVGKGVTRFKPGDRVFGCVEAFTNGSYQEYLVSYGKVLARLPDNVSFEAGAVAAVGGLNALHFLRVAGLGEGGPAHKLLIIGAGGSIGTMAVQIAKAYGATVTVVDSTDKLDQLRKLGADHLVDFTCEDFASDGEVYDTVIDIVGRNARKNSFLRSLRAVKPGGWLILGNPPFRHLLLRLVTCWFTRKKIRFAMAGYAISDVEYLARLLGSEQVKPLVDSRFALADAATAHHYVESGKRIGNVVLQIQ